MIGFILKVIGGKFGGYILIALAVAVLGGFGAMGVKLRLTESALATAVRERDQANRDLGRCQAGRAALEASIGAQNAAVTAQAERSRQALQQAQDGLRRAQERNRGLEARIAGVRRPLTGTACEQADQAIGRARTELNR